MSELRQMLTVAPGNKLTLGTASMRLISIFAAASLSAVVLGALVCALSDVPATVWLRNLATWLVGVLAAAALAARARPGWLPVLLLAGPVALAFSFLGDGLSGVHRWIEAGGLRLNAAMLVLPMLVVAMACAHSPWRQVAVLVSLVLLVLQPDASQATALAAAAALIALRRAEFPLARVVVVAASAGLAAMAWLRPDPLEPVPEVEGILGLAAQTSPLLVGASLAALGATAIAPALAARRAAADLRLAAAALTVCVGLWTLAPFIGAFPVPFMGIGPSPILGAWLGVGLLAGLIRNRANPAPTAHCAAVEAAHVTFAPTGDVGRPPGSGPSGRPAPPGPIPTLSGLDSISTVVDSPSGSRHADRMHGCDRAGSGAKRAAS